MRKPKPEAYETNSSRFELEEIEVEGIEPLKPKSQEATVFPEPQDDAVSRHHDTTTPSNHATVIPRYHATAIEAVRSNVREIGKEAATHRFTVKEKQKIAKIIFELQQQGIRTTENEIARIAVNFVVDEFNEKGTESLLSQVLAALNK